MEGAGLPEAELQRQMEEKVAAERQKRVEHTQLMAIWRIGKQDLDERGWQAWYDLYWRRHGEGPVYKVMRLTKPKLTACIAAARGGRAREQDDGEL